MCADSVCWQCLSTINTLSTLSTTNNTPSTQHQHTINTVAAIHTSTCWQCADSVLTVCSSSAQAQTGSVRHLSTPIHAYPRLCLHTPLTNLGSQCTLWILQDIKLVVDSVLTVCSPDAAKIEHLTFLDISRLQVTFTYQSYPAINSEGMLWSCWKWLEVANLPWKASTVPIGFADLPLLHLAACPSVCGSVLSEVCFVCMAACPQVVRWCFLNTENHYLAANS